MGWQSPSGRCCFDDHLRLVASDWLRVRVTVVFLVSCTVSYKAVINNSVEYVGHPPRENGDDGQKFLPGICSGLYKTKCPKSPRHDAPELTI